MTYPIVCPQCVGLMGERLGLKLYGFAISNKEFRVEWINTPPLVDTHDGDIFNAKPLHERLEEFANAFEGWQTRDCDCREDDDTTTERFTLTLNGVTLDTSLLPPTPITPAERAKIRADRAREFRSNQHATDASKTRKERRA